MKSKTKIFFIIKLVIFVVLMIWLYQNEKFNLENIKLGISNYKAGLFFLLLTFLQLLLGVVRTKQLMQFNREDHVTLGKILSIVWGSHFINCIAPSSLFGDVFKMKELMEIDTSTSKDNTVYASIFSKVFSTVALVLISIVAGLFMRPFPEGVTTLMFTLYSILAASLLGFLFRRKLVDLILPVFNKAYDISKREFYVRRLDNFKKYNKQLLTKRKIVLFTFISILIQMLNTISFLLIIYVINPDLTTSLAELTVVIPIGIFIMLIPISFSGLGVGHLAFSKLLLLFGITNGADVFTIYFAFSYVFNLLGIVPFVMLFKKSGKEYA